MEISKYISYLRIIAFSIVTLIMTSCVLSPTPFREVKYHDLGNPPVINKGGPYVDFAKFFMNGPYKTKMVFRSENNELMINEYHRWAQAPEALIGRYLDIAFRDRSEKDEKKYTVKGSILVFEADDEKSQANLMIEYTIVEPFQGRRKSFSRTLTAKMAKKKPELFAKAMAEIAANLAEQLKQDMLSMK